MRTTRLELSHSPAGKPRAGLWVVGATSCRSAEEHPCPKLSDIQLLLLTTAAARPEGSLLPPPDRLVDHQARLRRSILALIKIGMVEERPIDQGGHIWREEGEQRLGAFITQEGRIAIGEPLPVTPSPSSSKIDKATRDGATAYLIKSAA